MNNVLIDLQLTKLCSQNVYKREIHMENQFKLSYITYIVYTCSILYFLKWFIDFRPINVIFGERKKWMKRAQINIASWASDKKVLSHSAYYLQAGQKIEKNPAKFGYAIYI